MRIPSAYWFGLTLLSGLLFLWCLLSVIEAEALAAGWIWGLVVFGLVLIIAAAMSLITFSTQGGQLGRKDALTRVQSSAPPRATGGLRQGADQRLTGLGEVPRPSAGRSLT